MQAGKATWKLSESQRDDLARRYALGEKSSDLSKDFGVNRNNVCRIVKRRGIQVRSQAESRRRLALNQSAFSEITPESAYWIGFLMADGGINGTTVCLALSGIDISHLEKFKSFFGSGGKITKYKAAYTYKGETTLRDYCRFSVCSEKLTKDLAHFGVVPRKSKIAKASGGLETNRDFWRGVVDGDGCLFVFRSVVRYVPKKNKEIRRGKSEYFYPGLDLCGSEFLMCQFLDFVKNVCPGFRGSVRPRKNIFCVHSTGRHVKTIISALYENASIALDRKSRRAADFSVDMIR